MKANKSSPLLASPHAYTLSQGWLQPSIKERWLHDQILQSILQNSENWSTLYPQSPQLPSSCKFSWPHFKFPNAIKGIVVDKNHCILSNDHFLTWLRKTSHSSWKPCHHVPTIKDVCPWPCLSLQESEPTAVSSILEKSQEKQYPETYLPQILKLFQKC